MRSHSVQYFLVALTVPYLMVAAAHAGESATDSAFTYQGQLKQDGVPVNDTCALAFHLRTDPLATDETGLIATILFDGSDPVRPPVEIRSGLFHVVLDFPLSAIVQRPVWLDVVVRCPADSNEENISLMPRQEITSVPFSAQTRDISVDDSGRVGINTTPSSSRLTIDGPDLSGSRAVLRVQSGLDILLFDGDQIDSNRTLYINKNSAVDTVLGSGGGNVGVGISSPESKLHVGTGIDASPSAGGYLVVGPTTSVNLAFDGDDILAREDGDPGSLYLNRDGADVLLNINSGNVGIGTAPDKARLEVRSTNSRPTAWLTRRNPQDFSVVEILTLRTLTLGSERNGLGGRISFRGHVPGFADSAAPNFGDIDVIRQDGGDAGEMIFRVRTGPWVDNTDEITERMRLTPDFVQVKGPLHAQSSLNINSASNYADRIAPLVVGDATGTGAAILMDGNQIEAASGIDLIINFNSAADLRLNEGGGDVGIGRTPNFQLHLSRNSAAKPTSNVWTISSDERLKKNIKAIDGALDDLLRLRGVTYQWRDPESQGRMNGTYTGMIAQEVERVFPQWIGQDANGYKTLTVIGFEGIVVEALRELREEKDRKFFALRAETDRQLRELRDENDRQLRRQELQILGLGREVAAMHGRLARLESMLASNKESTR